MLAALDGTRSAEQLVALFPDVAPALLQGLGARNLLLDGGLGLDGDQTDLQTAAGLVGIAGDAGAATSLKNATVAFAGSGPVALSTALCLAKAGIGKLVFDSAELLTASEVAACPTLPVSATGQSRDEALRDALASVTTVDVRALLQLLDADVVIAEQRYTASGLHPPAADAALAAGVPYLTHGQDALVATVGPVVRRGGRPCHRCVEARRQANIAHIDEHAAYLAHRSSHAPVPDAFLAAHTALVAGHLATDVLRALIGPPASDASVLVIDLESGLAQREPVLALPRCEGCAGAPG